MDHKIINRLANAIQTATADDVQKLACPTCAGPLAVQYTSLGRNALSVACPNCMWRVVSDGIPEEPPWVRGLGRKIRTGKRKVPLQKLVLQPVTTPMKQAALGRRRSQAKETAAPAAGKKGSAKTPGSLLNQARKKAN